MKKQINHRWRKVKKWGNSLVVVFNKMDVKDLSIKENDMADISDMIIMSEDLYNLKTGDKE
jgi:hypothetical protein